MNTSRFTDLYHTSPCILGEGAVIERLRRDSAIELHPLLANAAFIYSEKTRTVQERICRQYLEIGREVNLPILLSTPTWRANRERTAEAGYAGLDVNGDNAKALGELRSSCGRYAEKVLLSGLMSCRGNAYAPEDALGVSDAEEFHGWQANKLAESEVDLIMASTLPALSEATGIARALAAVVKPYVISFVVRPEGTLLDGTPLHDAISSIDVAARPQPFGYMINCSHASFARAALLHPDNSSPHVRQRVIGLLANTAALTPEELDERESLVEEAPETFGSNVASLHHDLGLKILGGCCGTDDRHIRALAEQLSRC